ncbi:MAG TPA: SulP family inorganic anion transporter [Gemmatimonadales bacterium]|nr:SulP family inorganic anion transporter [Gemmatimonadales bacterium]
MSKRRRLPILDWVVEYRKEWVRFDVVAGLTTAAVVIPKAMAYATIAGLPVQIGLYTALVPMVIYAVLGTSRVLSVSTTTTIAILTATEMGRVAPDGDAALLIRATATLALLVGGILLVASVLRLGFVANFISDPVLIGFKAGIGLVIVLDQLPKLLGIHFDKGNFFHNLVATIREIPHTSVPTFAVGAGTILLLVGIEHLLPRAPAPLIAIAAGIAATSLFGLQAHGVAVVGQVPQGLPSFVSPDLSLLALLWPGALGIALMSFTETIAAARAFAASGDPRLLPNRELFATGLANAGAAFWGSMPAGGGTSQTAVNRVAGARTQLAELVTAGATLLTMLLLAGPMGLMPQAALAGVVIVYSVGLIEVDGFRAILRVRRTEFIWALVALAGVVLLGTLKGILVAIVVSLVALGQQVASPPVYGLGRKPGTNIFRRRSEEHPEDETFPGLLLLRVEGRVFFLNARRIGEKVESLMEEASPKVVAIDLSGVFDLEYTALKALIEAEKRLRENGVSVWLVGLAPAVLETVQRSSLGATLGRERMHFNLEVAVQQYGILEKSA